MIILTMEALLAVVSFEVLSVPSSTASRHAVAEAQRE